MAWNDLGDLEHQLQLALQRFDWEAADETCRNIIDRLPGETAPFPAQTARALLQALRRKRRFAAMGLLAEAFLESGLRTAQIRRQYGQALNRSRHAFRCRTVPAGAYPGSGNQRGGTGGSTRPDGSHLQAALCRRSWKSEP